MAYRGQKVYNAIWVVLVCIQLWYMHYISWEISEGTEKYIVLCKLEMYSIYLFCNPKECVEIWGNCRVYFY